MNTNTNNNNSKNNTPTNVSQNNAQATTTNVANNNNNNVNQNTNTSASASANTTKNAEDQIKPYIDLVDKQIKDLDKLIAETKDSEKKTQLTYSKMQLLQQQLKLKQLQEQKIKDQTLSTELYKLFEVKDKNDEKKNTMQNCLTLLANEIDKLDYNEKKKITQELGKYKDLDIGTQMQLVNEYLHAHPNMLKSDRQIRDDIDDLSRKNLSEIIDKNSKINDILSKHKESMYQDIENESKFNEKIRKLNKEIYELDEQIGIWEQIKNIFGCSKLCDCMKEAVAQKEALKNKKAILDWRTNSFDQQSINHDNVLKTAINNTMNTSQKKNIDVARTTESQEKAMQIFNTGKADNNFKSAGAIVSKNNNKELGFEFY